MNSCVLMAQIMSEPELRCTQDNTPLAQMLIQFPALREGDPPGRIKAVGWGKLGGDIQESYHEGDQVLIVGRLSMNTIDRPEGFKEKKAEFVISQIQSISSDMSMSATSPAMHTTTPSPVPNNIVPLNSAYQSHQSSVTPIPSLTAPAEPEPNLDDIPF